MREGGRERRVVREGREGRERGGEGRGSIQCKQQSCICTTLSLSPSLPYMMHLILLGCTSLNAHTHSTHTNT